jgi:NitT/TauT family transport system substrate-binding protein
VKEVWPGFISCVLAVHEDTIKNRRAEVQALVDGIAKSGKWLDANMTNRMDAAQFVSKFYYNQHPRLLEFVLSKQPDRVIYSKLSRCARLRGNRGSRKEAGILQGFGALRRYVDTSFARKMTPSSRTLRGR